MSFHSTLSPDPQTSARRARALRAAQVVTLSASLGTLGACGGSDTDTIDAFVRPDAFSAPDAFMMGPGSDAGQDAAVAMDAPSTNDAPSTSDAASTSDAPSADDAGPADDAYTFMGDGGCGPAFPPDNQACCVLAGGFWDEPSMFCAIAVPGPFVPPSMVG
jgi:hypothetical protein